MQMKHYFKVTAKHWWYWLSPSWRKGRKIILAHLDAEYEKLYTNWILYGSSTAPKGFYGKNIIDASGEDNV